MTTRAELVAKIKAKFPQMSMANPTNSDLYDILTLMLTDGGNPRQANLTATVDGLTTGLIDPDDEWLNVTAGGDANSIITLPLLATVSNGKQFRGFIGATGCELRTPASSNEKINNVDSDGTQELAIAAQSHFVITKLDDTQGWEFHSWTRLGAVVAAVIPD